METFWNFPSATGGIINSINHAGLETFRGNALESLTREICQNSLDAVKDQAKPVIVEFKNFIIQTQNFPQKDELLQTFYKCDTTWKGRNKKSEEFIENAISVLKQDEMQFLRISDFNTRGLEGAEDGHLGSPWSSLIKEAGSSNKDEKSGGSFGIGKSAPFLVSDLRTLFYSSVDITGYESHIGVANIMSFEKENNQISLGTGFYTIGEHSPAIKGQLQLDTNFSRAESGTDIYVSAFNPKKNWTNEVKLSVLRNFFITIFSKKLIVRINDFEINHNNIAQLIYELEDNEQNQILKNYFKLLTSDQTIKVLYPKKNYKSGISFQEGEAELYLISGEDLNRRVLMTRKTGMRIFEQKNISGSISFTGILMITGTNMNSVFKQMENPAHNAWSHDRFEKNPKLAQKIYSDLRKFIRNTVKEKFQEKMDDEMDAVGLNEFLPNKLLATEKTTKKVESGYSNIKTFTKKEIIQEQKNYFQPKGDNFKDIDEQLAGEFGITPSGDKAGNRSVTENNGNSADGGGLNRPDGVNELDKNNSGELDLEKKKNPKKTPIRTHRKYICVNKNKGIYRFNITPEKSLASGYLSFIGIGEQNDYKLNILNARTDDKDVVIDKFEGNRVFLHSIPANKSFILEIEIDYDDYCVLEVGLYEN